MYSKILVPLDGSALTDTALPHALTLAMRLNCEVHLVRVYTLPAKAYVVASGMIDQAPVWAAGCLAALPKR